MNLRKNNGFVGIDISLAVIIILILIPTLMGLIYKANSTRQKADIKAEALSILANAVEAAKLVDVGDLTEEAVLNKLKSNVYNDKLTIESDKKTGVVDTDIASYRLEIDVRDYQNKGIVKTVKAIVTYKFKRNEESMDLSLVIS